MSVFLHSPKHAVFMETPKKTPAGAGSFLRSDGISTSVHLGLLGGITGVPIRMFPKIGVPLNHEFL